MLVYGKNVFNQIQNDPSSIQEVFILQNLKDQKIQKAVELTENASHQGIVAKVKDIPTYSLEELLKEKKGDKPGLYIALDGIQDPHNFGSILRSADCTGVDGVIITKHNSVGLTPAAIKASTGAAYTIPVAVVSNLSQALKKMKEEGYWVAGADMDHARDYRQGMYEEPTVLVIGSEGKGISPLVKKQCDYMVKLPMLGEISSLNASVACAILLYEILNKREPLQ